MPNPISRARRAAHVRGRWPSIDRILGLSARIIAAVLLSCSMATASTATELFPGSAEYGIDPALKPAIERLQKKDCRGASSELDKADTDETDALSVMIIRVAIAISCAPEGKAAAMVAPALERAAARAPEDYRVAFSGMVLGLDLEDFALLETWTTRLATQFPNMFDILSVRTIESVLDAAEEQKGKAARDRLALMVAEAGYGTSLLHDLEARDRFLRETARLAEAEGKPDLARRLLLRMVDATGIGQALVDRRLATHWSALEASAGPHMREATRRAVEAAQELADKTGDTPLARRNLMQAPWSDGQREEALALGEDHLRMPEQAAIAEHDSRHLVDIHARMLMTMERIDEADRRYEALTRGAAKRPRPLLHFGFHRAQMLARTGRHEEALKLIAPLRETAREAGLRQTQRGLLRTEICALSALGRKDRLAGLKAELLALSEDEETTHTAEALLCLGETDAAANAVIRQLESEGGRLWALEALNGGMILAYDDPCVWSLAALAGRPDVAAAIAKAGRILPLTMLPAGRSSGAA